MSAFAHAEPSTPGRRVLAGATALLVAGAAAASALAGRWPLTTVVWSAAFLLLAVHSDLARQRIPNAWTLPTILAGLVLGALHGGAAGATQALLGCAVALLFFLPFYACGGMGAGDVKAAMALGALFGPLVSLRLALVAVALGGLLGLARVVAAGELGHTLRRWSASLVASVAARRPIHLAPTAGSAGAGGVPFGLALGLGVVLCLAKEAWA